MDLKRTIVAVALSMAVLLFFQYFVAPNQPAQPARKDAAQASAPKELTEHKEPEKELPAGTPTGASAETRAVLENDLLSVEFSSRAGAVVGARLTKYGDRPGPGASPVRLFSSPSGVDAAGATQLLGAMPQWAVGHEEVARGADKVVYRWRSADGIEIEKTYALEPGLYDVRLTVRVRNGTAQTLRDRLGVVLVQEFGPGDSNVFMGPAYDLGGKLEEVAIGDIKKGAAAAGEIFWAALVDRFFLAAAVPDDPIGSVRVTAFGGMEKAAEVKLETSSFDIAPGGEKEFGYRLYLGPKEAQSLEAVSSHLKKVVDYGWFDVIAKPLLWFLNAIYRVAGNYGIAIIILTTCIKAAFWPLSARSFRSMQRMKDLQPKMARLKEKYANDRERLNSEVMQLYRTHKVNPLGGCLPMIVQIPFFFALYKILLISIELRHAPFFLWIQDLSAKDPYYVTPLLMGASMFLQQKMTPMTGGPEAQMKMMMYGMPVVFTFMFLNFPAGLVIYWLVNNVLSIAQQWMMLRKSGQPAA